MRQVLKYPGSKWRIADWIISKFPEHHSYLEPFFGSGAVLFSKNRSNIETVNDLDSTVCKLFRMIRENPEEIARMVELTPFSRAEYDETFEQKEPDTDAEQVRRFWFNVGRGTVSEQMDTRLDGKTMYKDANGHMQLQTGTGFRNGLSKAPNASNVCRSKTGQQLRFVGDSVIRMS